MGILKKLFGIKDNRPVEEDVKGKSPEEVIEESHDYPLCERCGMELKPDHFIVTLDKKKFHKQCMRQIRREARRKAFS